MRLTEIRVAGFGGQGVILSAIVLGKAASIYENGFATMTQNFGPEARGGACSAQLVLSDSPVLYPYVTRPDIMVVMSQEAYNRFAPELKPEGMLIIEEDLVRVSDVNADKKVYSIPATRIAEELGKRMVLNSVMVGFFTAVTKLLTAGCRAQGRGRLGAAEFPRAESARPSKRDSSTATQRWLRPRPGRDWKSWRIRASNCRRSAIHAEQGEGSLHSRSSR